MQKIYPRILAMIILILLTNFSLARAVFLYTPEAFLLKDTVIRPFQETLQPDTLANDTLIRDTIPPVSEPADTLLPAEALQRGTVAVPTVKDEEKLPRSAIPRFSEQQLQTPFALQPRYIDTLLLDFHIYDPIKRKNLFTGHKGNIGHPNRLLTFDPKISSGLNTGEYELYGAYLFRHDDLLFYRPKHVFTELFYVFGDNREQYFYAKHKQKVHETTHVGLQYRVVNSPGAFSRINARNTNLYLTADFLSPDQRYQALGTFVFNRVRNQESAGLEDHVAFEEDQDSDFVLLERAEAWYRDFSINLRHFYQTGFYTAADTVQPGRFINLGRINHDFTFERKAFIFNENEPPFPFYDHQRFNENLTYDSTVVHRIENLVSWSNFPLTSGRGTFPFNFRVFARHSINTIQQPAGLPKGGEWTNEEGERIYHSISNSYNEIVLGADLQSDQRRFISFGGYANTTVGGYHDEDFHAGGFLNIGGPERSYNLELMLRYALAEAPFFYNRMSVNNVVWENDFDKTQMVNLRARLKFPFLTLEGNYYLLDRWVFAGPDALPVQNTTELGYFSLGAYSNIRVGPFGFRNHILLQEASSANFQQLPQLISYHSVFVNFGLSGNNLINQVGFDFHYNSAYQAMAYMPVTRLFYNQNEHTLREKIQLDAFWNGKIGPARLFVKFENLLGLVLDLPPHYDIPFYPWPEAAFKFGVSWMFFD